jgi:hypothetical protein
VKVSFDVQYKPWLAASTDDCRPILNSVFVDPSGFLVATDTNCMAAIVCYIEEAPEDFKGVMIPAAWLARVYKERPKYGSLLELEIDLEAQTVSCQTTLGLLTERLVEGQFPQWKRVVPVSDDCLDEPSIAGLERQLTEARCQAYNPALLTKVSEAIGWTKGKYSGAVAMYLPTGLGPALIFGPGSGTPHTDAFGVLMPGMQGQTAVKLREEIRQKLNR